MSEKKATLIPMGFAYLMSSLQIGVVKRSQDTSHGKQMGNAAVPERECHSMQGQEKMSISFCNEIWFISPHECVLFLLFLMAQRFKGSLDIHSLKALWI